MADIALLPTPTQLGLALVATSGSYADLSGKPTIGSAAALNVGTTVGTVAAGDDARITGAVQPNTTPDLAGARINGAAGAFRNLVFATSGSNRWVVTTDNVAEAGSNVGSDLRVKRYADDGSYLGDAIVVKRSTGVVNFASRPTVAGDYLVTRGDELRYASIVEMGTENTGDRYTGFDLHSSDGVDYSTRIIRDAGANGPFRIEQSGTGGIQFNGGAASFSHRPTYGGVGLATLAEISGGGSGVAGVSSFKGRTGAVDTASGDYSIGQIAGAGTSASKDTGRGVGAVLVYEDTGGLPTLVTDNRILIRKSAVGPTDFAILHVDRDANFTGGTSGVVNGAIVVSNTVRAGVVSYEWGLQAISTNYSTTGEHSAAYSQANSEVDGSLWAHVFEHRDKTTNPSRGKVSIEANINANGGDPNQMRRVVDVVLHKLNSSGSDVVADRGVSIGTGAGASFVRALHIDATAQIGIDLSGATLSQNAIRLKANQTIALEETGQVVVTWNGSKVQIKNGGTVLAQWP